MNTIYFSEVCAELNLCGLHMHNITYFQASPHGQFSYVHGYMVAWFSMSLDVRQL